MLTHPKTLEKLIRMATSYERLIFKRVSDISCVGSEIKEHLRQVPPSDSTWVPYQNGDLWGEAWGNLWLKAEVELDASWLNKDLFLKAETGAWEVMLYVNGAPKGIFSKELETGARGYHHTIKIANAETDLSSLELALECYAGHPCVGTHPMDEREEAAFDSKSYRRTFQGLELVQRNDLIKDFVFDLKTLNQLVSSLPENSFRRGDIIRALLEVYALVPQMPSEHPEEQWLPQLACARDVMAPLLACKNSASAPKAGIIGHSHMDTAWLWTSKETIRKCARTWSNALNLMEQYPEYKFIQSSPIHMEMIRKNYPSIFEKIKEKVKEKRWEPNGGMYVESDGNMPSGESFARQFLYGQKYTREHFDFTSDSFWLPDTFGYSPALPQIMRQCGIKYFLTTKLTWNDTNTFPHDTFKWEGIDGTEVLVHFNETHCWPDPETLIDRLHGGVSADFRTTRNCIQHKELNNKRLISYGFGDGGGGPMYEMLEMARRVEDLEGCPKTEHCTVSEFMNELEEDSARFPSYYGELYVEGHRGVLTVQHEIKRLNRRLEEALKASEMLANLLNLGDQEQRIVHRNALERIWKVCLKNQFHDILPGTSIPEEHELAKREMAEAISDCEKMIQDLTSGQDSGSQMSIFHPHSWDFSGDLCAGILPVGQTLGDSQCQRQDIENLKGQKQSVIEGITSPALSMNRVDLKDLVVSELSPFSYENQTLMTPHYKVRFDEAGYLAELIDLKSSRRLDMGTRALNTFMLGEDIPALWDNWDIDEDQHLKLKVVDQLMEQSISQGPLQFRIRNTYKLGLASTLWQDVIFHKNSGRIDFETKVDWQEPHAHLKTCFDLNIHTKELKSETQYGWFSRSMHSNTSFDKAKFEFFQHRWSHLGEPNYGMAILNDSNYGLAHHGSELRLSLLKSGGHPDPGGDAGIHYLNYALYPHSGSFSAQVIHEAHQFNQGPLVFQQAQPKSEALVSCSQDNIIIDAIKTSECGQDIIVRLYEAEGSSTNTALVCSSRVSSAQLCNMLEEHQSELEIENQGIGLNFRAFEVKTIRLRCT